MLPICRAIKVFPVPGGPNKSIPRVDELIQCFLGIRTLDMLNSKLLNQSWRKDTTRESSSENRGEFGIQTTDTHILEFKVGGKNGIGGTATQLSDGQARLHTAWTSFSI
jgi:hypothetical protein